MSKVVKGGQVVRPNAPAGHLGEVNEIDFPGVAANATVPTNGATGTMLLKQIIPHNDHTYNVNEHLNYMDTNRHNDYSLRVTKVHGPLKYEIVTG